MDQILSEGVNHDPHVSSPDKPSECPYPDLCCSRDCVYGTCLAGCAKSPRPTDASHTDPGGPPDGPGEQGGKRDELGQREGLHSNFKLEDFGSRNAVGIF